MFYPWYESDLSYDVKILEYAVSVFPDTTLRTNLFIPGIIKWKSLSMKIFLVRLECLISCTLVLLPCAGVGWSKGPCQTCRISTALADAIALTNVGDVATLEVRALSPANGSDSLSVRVCGNKSQYVTAPSSRYVAQRSLHKNALIYKQLGWGLRFLNRQRLE